MVGGVDVFCRKVQSGAVLGGAELEPPSSATLKLMMSTMLDTSFLILPGRLDGSDLPVNLRLQRYMAKANSGKCS